MSARKILLSQAIYTAVDAEPLIDGYLLLEGEKILKVAKGMPSAEELEQAELLDYRGKLLTPGLVDAHTHLVHGGSRESELALKLAGASYMEVHEEGGIKSTVKHTRAASCEELYDKAYKTLHNMLLHGTTTVEAKSGYGLDRESELRVLKVMQKLQNEQALDLVPTYMGAHDVPPEFSNAEDYINFMIEEVMPEVKAQNLAEFCDVFCEEGIFSLDETRKIAEAAQAQGFKIKVHADEIAAMGGAGLAVDLGAASAEHLMAISDADIEKMAKSDTVAVLLPATTFFLRAENFAPAKKMLKAGVTVALASDYNPGSSPCENLQMSMWQACYGMGLEPLDVLKGVTLNAAKAICREKEIGSLEPGKYADICVFDAKSPAYLLYHFGVNSICDVFKKGEQVVKNQVLCAQALRRVINHKQ